jgi:hypothetical protein
MGDWHLVALPVQSLLSRWAAFLSEIPESIALATILLPIALAIFSKRLIVVLGSILLALVCLCLLVAPANLAEVLATGFYLGSLTIALSGIIARHRAEALQVLQGEVDRLRRDVNALSHAEQRRFMKELKGHEGVSIIPGADETRGNGSSSDTKPLIKKTTRQKKPTSDASTTK